jgi:uncharacterized SAM-binding protein YcdF (DUF218 family)
MLLTAPLPLAHRAHHFPLGTLSSLLVFALSFWSATALADPPQATSVDAESQEKVAHLLQTVIQDYWNAADAQKATGTNATANYTNVEAAFRKASMLMPNRLDFRFGIASSLMLQGIQTNGSQLEMKVKKALVVYQEIHALDTNGFDAPILYAAYTRALGETNASDTALRALMAVHPERTADYLQRFRRIDRILQTSTNLIPCRTMPRDQFHAIVILGAGLETNGTMKAKLEGRLSQGLKFARLYPRAPIILTGGNQKSGVTEAYTMSQWLQQRGIPRKRLILEDQAKDTVANAIFSSAILKRLRVTHVTLVTSSSHMRRGLADLQEACLQRGLLLQYDTLAAQTKGDADLEKQQERVGIYRDVMRISGLWSFPGLQR